MTKNPLEIPEILTLVGMNLPIWHYSVVGIYLFQPKEMLSCLQVSHHFRNTLLPILWYTFDEKAMAKVPVDIIRKYTPYFRVHHNYGHQQAYPTNNREPCTNLIQLTMSTRHDVLDRHDIAYINNNPGLRLLGGSYLIQVNTVYADTFTNLRRLNHLDIQLESRNRQYHRELLQPISTTLTSLRLVGLKGPLGLRELVFPNLKELHPRLSHPQDMQDLLQGCPYLEAIIEDPLPPQITLHLIHCLKSGICPVLRNLRSNVYRDQMEDFSEMLENRSGLQML
ncbi:hypothetical protein BGZ65_004125, partial [Modicella reniformis]